MRVGQCALIMKIVVDIRIYLTIFSGGGSDFRIGAQRSNRRPVLFRKPIIQATSQNLRTDPRLQSRIFATA